MTDAIAAALYAIGVAALFVLIFTTPAPARDDRCRQLEDLNRQYVGASLLPWQREFKRKAVAWYQSNCRRRGGFN